MNSALALGTCALAALLLALITTIFGEFWGLTPKHMVVTAGAFIVTGVFAAMWEDRDV